MDAHRNNPPDNLLGSGISDVDLEQAIEASGYPLQAIVADKIQNVFESVGDNIFYEIQEEWSYVDSNTGTIRSLDIWAEARMPHKEDARIRPAVQLLIECKQFELPTVFFIRPAGPSIGIDYPRVAGCPHKSISVKSSADSDTHSLDTPWILGFGRHEFNTESVPAVSMARVHRKNGKLVLSGEETYPNIVQPLAKATDHFILSCEPHSTQCYFDLRMVASVAVIRGPMVGIIHESGEPDRLEYVPWVRLHRLEPSNQTMSRERGVPKPIDVVHASYFENYARNLMNFAAEMSKCIGKIQIPIIWGEGKVPKAHANDFVFADIFAMLRPTVTRQTFERAMEERMYKAHSGDLKI